MPSSDPPVPNMPSATLSTIASCTYDATAKGMRDGSGALLRMALAKGSTAPVAQWTAEAPGRVRRSTFRRRRSTSWPGPRRTPMDRSAIGAQPSGCGRAT